MNRIFWRHAEAGFAHNDLARPLTARGEQQAARSAQWLHGQNIAYPAYCSQALRGQQTAACYRPPHILAGLNPDCGLQPVWQALDTLPDNAVIIGHMPWIGAAIARYLDGTPAFIGYSELYWLSDENGTWQLKGHYHGA